MTHLTTKILVIITFVSLISGSTILYLNLKHQKEFIDTIHKTHSDFLQNLLEQFKEDGLKKENERNREIISFLSTILLETINNEENKANRDLLIKILDFTLKNKGMLAIEISDVNNKTNLTIYKKNSKLIHSKQSIPEFIINNSDNTLGKMTIGVGKNSGTIQAYLREDILISDILLSSELFLEEVEFFMEDLSEEEEKLSEHKPLALTVFFILLLVTTWITIQVMVNSPLQKIKKGLDDFFLVLSGKNKKIDKIEINTKDEFQSMANSLNNNIEISVEFYNKIRELNITLKQTSDKSRTLLDNAHQGFLTFSADFMVDEEYSKKSSQFLGKDISNKDISTLLFQETKDIDKFKSILKEAFEIKDDMIQESMLSLLPSEITLNSRALSLEYIVVGDDVIMLIITNISEQKNLESKLDKKQNTLNMIITIIENSDMFYNIQKDFKYFSLNKNSYIDDSKSSLENINTIKRVIHTFKGSFLQLHMNDVVNTLHKIESEFSEHISTNPNISNKDIIDFLNEIDFYEATLNDIATISQLLGKKFIQGDNLILVDKIKLNTIKNEYIDMLAHHNIESKSSNNLLTEIKELTHKNLFYALKSYSALSIQLAENSKKEIYKFDIIGDDNVVVPEKFSSFIESLGHLFRNSIDHGIEVPEKRLELGKDKIGSISCSFMVDDDKLQIIISDDGAGIDVEKIKLQVSETIDVSNLKDEEIHQLIFACNVTIKDEVSKFSGHGIGMGAVKEEVDNLDGTIEVKSELNIGTTYTINFPISGLLQ